MSRHDGSITTELVLTAPVLLVLLAFVVMSGRLGAAAGGVRHAAEQAARAASLRADPSSATAAAESTALTNLASRSCTDVSVEVDTSRLHPGGDVVVTVTCTAAFSDLAFAGLPGHRTYTAQAIEIVDIYRGDG